MMKRANSDTSVGDVLERGLPHFYARPSKRVCIDKKEVRHAELAKVCKDEEEEHAHIPKHGIAPQYAKNFIADQQVLDFQPKLNTSSYVNVVFDEEEKDCAVMGMHVNLADQTVYPQSFKLHDRCVNMIANLWNAPQEEFEKHGVFPGAGTVGSTEGCLLAGLALKFRWRAWYAEKHNMTAEQVLGVRPNLVISTQFQAAWEKLFKYFDVEPRIVPTSIETFQLDPSKIAEYADDKTMGVVAIMGNHYGGQYDDVQAISDILDVLNQKNGWQIPIHVDGASGGFIAPFQKDLKPWDFRVKNVMSISASGHKFGQSVCGTGWVVWRQREDLAEHVAISVSYLGGEGESYTLNFSRPASGVYVQMYKFLRLGVEGYTKMNESMQQSASRIREHLRDMKCPNTRKPRFVLLDQAKYDDKEELKNKPCLPVVTAMLNPECEFLFDDIDLQYEMSRNLWYVSGYRMNYHCPASGQKKPLFHDADSAQAMFRVVCKANLSMELANHLCGAFDKTCEELDHLAAGFKAHHIKAGGKDDLVAMREGMKAVHTPRKQEHHARAGATTSVPC